jgi:hypothetical protein
MPGMKKYKKWLTPKKFNAYKLDVYMFDVKLFPASMTFDRKDLQGRVHEKSQITSALPAR